MLGAGRSSKTHCFFGELNCKASVTEKETMRMPGAWFVVKLQASRFPAVNEQEGGNDPTAKY